MSFALRTSRAFNAWLTLSFCMFVACGTVAAHAREKVLYSFRGGADGVAPSDGVTIDGSGVIYGTTATGGGGTCFNGFGCGTVFSLTPRGGETVIHAFQDGDDGALPDGRLFLGKDGSFYGMTKGGGNGASCGGCGTIFKVTPDGAESVLYSFQGGTDGAYPAGGVIEDESRSFYGTTAEGGKLNANCFNGGGCGTVFELKSDGTKLTLYSFEGGNDGAGPQGGVIEDANGNLYGTTELGGTGNGNNCAGGPGCGTVFKIAPDGSEKVLYSFQGGSDGYGPGAELVMDGAGNLYGTTGGGGGGGGAACGEGCGTVFKLAPDGTESVLYAFKGGTDGAVPDAAVILDGKGNLYGTTFQGGGIRCRLRSGCGTVFKLTPGGQETVLARFRGGRGQFPEAPVLLGKNGALYGTASAGGRYKDGVVFKIKQ